MTGPTILPFDEDAIGRAAALIAAGQVVAVPTETVYGLAADARSAATVARIYAAKSRPSFNPLIVHVPDVDAARALAVFDEDAEALAAAFWPGPLTLVLPVRAEAELAPAVTAGLSTVAVRVPAGRAMRALLGATGAPLAAPSANRSGAISPTCAQHVAASLGKAVPLIIDDGACPQGLESTIVKGRKVLRPGPITAAEVFATLSPGPHPGEGRGPVATHLIKRTELSSDDAETAPRLSPGWTEEVIAPGQLESHYAPIKPLRLDATSATPDEWLIGFGPIAGDDNLSPAADLEEAAADLFAALHRADASDRARIAVAPIPPDGVGEAINDRLRRAAHR